MLRHCLVCSVLLVQCCATSSWSSPWYFLGPWSVGKTEIDGDPLFSPLHRNTFITNVTKHDHTNTSQPSHFSELVMGGKVSPWSPLHADQNGFVQVGPSTYSSSVDFSNLIRLTSSITIQEFQGMLSREITIRRGKAGTYSLICEGLHTIEIDDYVFQSDIYSSQQIYAVAHLSVGKHRVESRVRGKGTARFRCTLSGPRGGGKMKMFLPPSVEIPDIVSGKLLTPHISLRVVNLGSIPLSRWTFSTDKDGVVVIPSERASSFVLYSSQTLALPVEIHLDDNTLRLPEGEQDDCLQFTLRMSANEMSGEDDVVASVVASVVVRLRCRKSDQSQLMTFMSHDGTVASAAFLRPRDYNSCRQTGCPVVLALSGVGVTPSNMADAFKYKTSEKETDYIFGLQHAFILAPERDGAHNFEGTGHKTAISSLLALGRLFPTGEVDVYNVVYAGHSRGGHGALLFATHLPDLACGVFSSNGWIRREYYGDANSIFQHDMQLSHADPTIIRRSFESSIIENDVSMSAPNMIQVPTLLRTSSDDGSVSPWFMRRFARILKTWEKEENLLEKKQTSVEFNELTTGNKGHWWWDTDQTNDGGVMFDPKVRNFLSTVLEHCSKYKEKAAKRKRFQVVSLNPSTFHSRNGMRIIQMNIPFRLSKLDVTRSTLNGAAEWHIRTTNVRRFAVKRSFFTNTDKSVVVVDGIRLRIIPPFVNDSNLDSATMLSFFRDDTLPPQPQWTVMAASKRDMRIPRGERRPGNTGPMRQVFDRPFLIVANSSATLHLAVLLSNSHFAGSKTTAPVFLAKNVNQKMKDTFNMIFIGKSSLRDEMVMSKLPPNFPVRFVKDNGFAVRGCSFHPGDHAGLIFLAPMVALNDESKEEKNNKDYHATTRLALIIDATDSSDLVDLFRGSFSSNTPLTRAMFTNMSPDFIVTNGKEYRWKGLGGLHMSGYWSYNWGWDMAMSSVSSEC